MTKTMLMLGLFFLQIRESIKKMNHVQNQQTKKKKVVSVLRHPVINLKKVARVPAKDRKEVLNVLKSKVRKRRQGTSSKGVKVTNGEASNMSGSSEGSACDDWKNWVILHGNEEVAVEDVWGICNN